VRSWEIARTTRFRTPPDKIAAEGMDSGEIAVEKASYVEPDHS
jgi:hypothetical protein